MPRESIWSYLTCGIPTNRWALIIYAHKLLFCWDSYYFIVPLLLCTPLCSVMYQSFPPAGVSIVLVSTHRVVTGSERPYWRQVGEGRVQRGHPVP